MSHQKSMFRKINYGFLAVCLVLHLCGLPAAAQKQAVDEEYTAKIKEFTTDPHFLTQYIDYLPSSDTVPTPLDVLGHIAGARDILTYTKDINRYLRALAEASPRVKLFPGGTTEEGRERIYVVVAAEDVINNLDKYKAINAKLADPRKISDQEAKELIQDAKVMYWATGAMHSGETGSPEMLMELAYRLAVDEGEFIRTIRDNAIVLITPVLEVDGREKMVDLAMAAREDPEGNYARRPLYWGKYVAHDNNRDNLGLALDLSRHLIENFLDWHPQVLHDLHESASHLYVSTGTGPYNAWLDPIVVDEWHMIAYQEVNEMTRMGVPGVWTHGFYDGWAPNYGFYAANGHNAIGRFYETQGAGDGSTRVITTRGDRAWYRANPPLRRTLWSLRNNVNLQGSGLQIAIHYVAANREKFMENFYLKGKRSLAKAYNEGPAAYVFPGDEPRPGQVKRLLTLLQRQGVEVHRADAAVEGGEETFPKGSYVVRMDQPYSRMADMMLDRQYFNTGDSRPYDDVGWTMGPLYNVKSVRITDTKILDAKMTLQKTIEVPGGVKTLDGSGGVKAYLINHNADNTLATFCFKNPGLKMLAAEKAFEVEGTAFNAGTFVVKTEDNSGDLKGLLDKAGDTFGFTAFAVSQVPDVAMHTLAVPRVAVMHTWMSTQTEGWVRIALDELEIPYDYISVHEPRDNPRLRDKYDVILFGPSTGNALSIVQGLSGSQPQPWKKTDLTPNIGLQDATDDMRGGLELEGVMHLKKFIEDGGLLITLTSSSSLPIHFGLARGMSIRQTQELWARGSVFRAEVADSTSPIMYGYDKAVGVYFSSSPVFALGSSGGRRYQGMGGSMTGRITGRGTAKDPDIPQGRAQDLGAKTITEFQKQQKEERSEQEQPRARVTSTSTRPRTVLRFTRKEEDLLISGGLAGGSELGGAPAVVDCTLGKGHVVMFSINPMWRHQTHGSYFMVVNAMLHFEHLGVK